MSRLELRNALSDSALNLGDPQLIISQSLFDTPGVHATSGWQRYNGTGYSPSMDFLRAGTSRRIYAKVVESMQKAAGAAWREGKGLDRKLLSLGIVVSIDFTPSPS